MILPVDEDLLEVYVLSHAPEYVADRREADEDLRAGATEPMSEAFGR